MASKKNWSDLSEWQKRALTAAGVVEGVLTVAAWRDLVTRPASQVRGAKRAWAVAIVLQPVGPLAYFAIGRR